MNTSADGFQLIRNEEGLTLVCKGDYGHLEIGYGHDLLPGESYPDGIDEATAEALLVQDIDKAESYLNPLIPASCTQNQYDALIDFTFNLGGGALATMLSHGFDQAPVQILRWNHAGGVVLAGLTARRQKEVALFTA
jgi:lysozyme